MDTKKIVYKFPIKYNIYLRGKFKELQYKNIGRFYIIFSIIIPLIISQFVSKITGILIILVILLIFIFEVFIKSFFKFLLAKYSVKAKYIEYHLSKDKGGIIIGTIKSEFHKNNIKKIKIYPGLIVFDINWLIQRGIMTPVNNIKVIEKDLKKIGWIK